MSYLSKFTAFQLDSPGSLFSFYKEDFYYLIEARLPKGGIDELLTDMAYHNKTTIDVLHITSWDADHCTYDDLIQIINKLRPSRIEVPDYLASSEDGKLCQKVIYSYDDIHQRHVHNVQAINDNYISSLPNASLGGSSNVIYKSMFNCDNKNDMSLIKFFRSVGFNVLSLGDCESSQIANRLANDAILSKEVDVLILAHHGANNGFTSPALLDALKPKIAICSSNNDNQYDHPHTEVYNMLAYRNIPLMTTKRGNVTIYQVNGDDGAVATNLISNNEVVDTRTGFIPKRFAN